MRLCVLLGGGWDGGEEVCSFSDGAGLHSTQQDGGKRGLSFVPCTLSSMSFFFFLFLVGGGQDLTGDRTTIRVEMDCSVVAKT